MLKTVIKKPLDKLGILNRVKSFQYKELMEILNIKDGFVYHTQQIEMVDGKLFSTGDDPQILIEFQNKTSSVDVEFNIRHNDDAVELFCSKDGVSFVEENKKIVGECDGEEVSETIPFNDSCKYFRLDLAQSSGEIEIEKISLSPNEFCGDSIDLGLEQIPETAGSKGYVVVTHAMDGTGAPLLVYNLCKTLKARGLGVVVVALSGGFLAKKYKEQQIPVFEFSQGQVTDEIVDKEDMDKLARGLEQKGYHNLLINTTVSGLVAPYFKKYDYKIISLIHEMKNSIVCYKMKSGGRNASFYSNYMVFPEKIVENEFYEVFNDAINESVILPQGLYKKYEKNLPNKMAVCKKYNIPSSAKIIFGSGPADFRKGIDLFFAAASELINKEKKGDPEYHFIWTGNYTDKNMINWFEYQFKKLGLESRIHVVRFIKDPKIYQNMVECADVFWLTSREDPFPSVMIESLKYGTPVIAFKGCGGADKLLSEGRGVLVENFDVNELASQTEILIANPAHAEQMLVKSQKYIKEHLNFDKYIDQIINYFNDDKKAKKYADLSVVIPNYNYEKYLPMRIKSILDQTVLPREIILLDDNSTDNSLEVAKPLLAIAKKNYGIECKIIKNDENQGCFNQWIKGFNEAKYEYVWIAEADDWAKPTFVETVMPSFRNKNVMLSYCKSCVIDSNSVVADYDYNSYIKDLDEHRWEEDFTCDGKKFVTDYLSQKNVIPNASSAIIRKSAADGIEKYLKKYQAIGDWFAYIFVIARGKVSFHAKVMNGHRRHGKSIIAKQEKSATFIKEIIMIKKYLIEKFKYDDAGLNKLILSTLGENFDFKLVESNSELLEDCKELAELCSKKRKRDNLLMILPDFEVGGGQAVGIRFANNFAKHYNVFVVNARERLETRYMRKMISPDVEVLKYNDDVDYLRFVNNVLKFKAVISLIWWSDKLSYLAFKDADIKRIISMHGCYEKILDYPEIDPFYNENVEDMLKSAAHVVYTAEKNKRVFKEKNIDIGNRLVKIDNGFSLGDFPMKTRQELEIGKNDIVFGLVARGIPEKGFEQAILGIEYVNKKLKNKCHLVLVASGEYIDGLKNKFGSEYIHFIDNTTEPLEWIGWENIFDVGLLPSYFESESMPTAIIEMMFLGKPIIATDIGEIKSMLDDGENKAGIVVPLKNGFPDQDSVNSAMLELATHPEKVKELKKGVVKMKNRFDMNRCIDEYRKLIED